MGGGLLGGGARAQLGRWAGDLGFGAGGREPDEVRAMAAIFAGLAAGLMLAALPLERSARSGQRWLPPATKSMGSKRWGEEFVAAYTPVWIAAIGTVIVLQLYEGFRRWEYLAFGLAEAGPFLLIPLLRPGPPDRDLPWHQRYIVKANLWIGIFSFIGNYWYTHYFYRVLKADYTFDGHRLNDVPISMFLMTHAYFMSYHLLSNAVLRRIRTSFAPGRARDAFQVAVVGVLAYTTAFMESLTICTFPYYRFENRFLAWTLGSAFYAIYFVVSFPMFFRLDESPRNKFTLWQTCVEALAAGMLVLCLLDFVRLAVGVELFAPH